MKKAYSLVELLLVLFVISVLSMLAIQIFNPKTQQYRQPYLTAYDTLVQAAGNAYLSWNPECTCPVDEKGNINNDLPKCWTRDCWERYVANGIEASELGGIIDFPREYPGYLFGGATNGTFDGSGTDVVFCNKFTENINTVNKEEQCQSFISGMSPNVNTAAPFRTTFCALQAATNGGDEVIQCAGTGLGSEGIIPTFITANGQRFYVSTILTATIPCIGLECLSEITDQTSDAARARKERMQYRLIVVDLNGNKAPNSQLQSGAVPPDTVLFALKSDGTVVPLGRPEIDQAYFSTHVEYPKFVNRIEDNQYVSNDIRVSKNMTMAEAKMTAWGYANEANVLDPESLYYGQHLIQNEPLSYSGYFHELANCDAIRGCDGEEFKGNNGRSKGVVYADALLGNIVRQFLYIFPNDVTTINNTEVVRRSIVDRTKGAQEGQLSGLLMTCDEAHGCICNTAESRCKVNFK